MPGLAALRRDRVEEDFRGDDRPVQIERPGDARMERAELGQHVLRAEAELARLARMIGRAGSPSTCRLSTGAPAAASSASASALAS